MFFWVGLGFIVGLIFMFFYLKFLPKLVDYLKKEEKE